MRKTLATLLHDFIRLANAEPPPDGLDGGWLVELKENLWPKPHNALFDFEATREGAEWIDTIAAEARKILLSDSSPAVVTHLDWGCRNMLAKNGQVTAVFDWDSIFLIPETQAVGDAAAGFLTTWYFDIQRVPTPDDSGAFVLDYESARGRSFTREEREIIAARTTYGLSYGARCGHALWKGNPPDDNTALARMKETGSFTPENMGLV